MDAFEIVMGIVSVVMLVGSLIAIPWFVRRLPQDYFVRPPPKRSLFRKVARNGIGFALIAAGIAMLVLPGQGVAAILVGLAVIDLPFKQRAMKWILKNKKIQEGLQRLRSKKGKQPFVIPAPT